MHAHFVNVSHPHTMSPFHDRGTRRHCIGMQANLKRHWDLPLRTLQRQLSMLNHSPPALKWSLQLIFKYFRKRQGGREGKRREGEGIQKRGREGRNWGVQERWRTGRRKGRRGCNGQWNPAAGYIDAHIHWNFLHIFLNFELLQRQKVKTNVKSTVFKMAYKFKSI